MDFMDRAERYRGGGGTQWESGECCCLTTRTAHLSQVVWKMFEQTDKTFGMFLVSQRVK